jgi:ribosomal protein S18 acetylase RimI-like enzyme
LQDFQGQRIGKQMLQKAIALAAEKSKKYIWLGVWEHNEDAIRFYQKYGFEKFATHPYFVGKDEQTDWLLRFDLINFQSD